MMWTVLLCGALLTMPTAEGEGETYYVDASLEPEGDVLGAEFVDLDGDGILELCLAVRNEGGERELRLHRISGQRIASEPWRVVRIVSDVQAYGFADVRAEPGKEILLLTRTGLHALSPTIEGMRGNVRRLLERELIYDVPDPDKLPFWAYVLPNDGGDQLIVPGRRGFSVWGPGDQAVDGAQEDHAYVAVADFDRGHGNVVFDAGGVQRGGRSMMMGSGGLRVDFSGLRGVFLGEAQAHSGSLVHGDRSYRAPAIADCNNDGRMDLIVKQDKGLAIYIAGPQGLPEKPTRVELWPSYLDHDNDELDLKLRLEDLDGDGYPDILAHAEHDTDGIENADQKVFILINDGQRLLPEKPTQVLRFEAAKLVLEVTDVDGDGRPDLGVRKFDFPSVWDLVTSLKFELTQLLYLGSDGRLPFERKPVLKSSKSFDETSVQAAIANRKLAMDCNGDGIADLVEIDLQGRIVIRRVLHESSFFGGDTWELDKHPWKTFEALGAALDLQVLDLNGDGIGDIVSQVENGLTVQLSARGRSQR